jgi:hypothetical protein
VISPKSRPHPAARACVAPPSGTRRERGLPARLCLRLTAHTPLPRRSAPENARRARRGRDGRALGAAPPAARNRGLSFNNSCVAYRASRSRCEAARGTDKRWSTCGSGTGGKGTLREHQRGAPTAHAVNRLDDSRARFEQIGAPLLCLKRVVARTERVATSVAVALDPRTPADVARHVCGLRAQDMRVARDPADAVRLELLAALMARHLGQVPLSYFATKLVTERRVTAPDQISRPFTTSAWRRCGSTRPRACPLSYLASPLSPGGERSRRG